MRQEDLTMLNRVNLAATRKARQGESILHQFTWSVCFVQVSMCLSNSCLRTTQYGKMLFQSSG